MAQHVEPEHAEHAIGVRVRHALGAERDERREIDAADENGSDVASRMAELVREIEALRTDVGAIEDRARADLGMVYPDEILLRVAAPQGTP